MEPNKPFRPHVIWYVSKYANAPLFGTPTRQFFFSKYMVKKGRKVFLICSRSSHSSNYEQLPDFGWKNEHRFSCDGVEGIMLNGAHIKYGFNLKRIISWFVFEGRFLYWSLFKAKEKPDVIIASSLSILTFLSASILKWKFRCKLITEVRDIWPLTIIESKKWSPKNPFIRFLSYVEKVGYKQADAIIGTMSNLVEHVKKISADYSGKVFYIPMGLDTDLIAGSDSGDPYASFFSSLSGAPFIVGYAGTIGQANCVDQIIESAKLLKDENILFVIMGGGPLKERIVEEARKARLAKVHFFDKAPKKMVTIFLKHADLLLNPWMGDVTIYRYGVSPNKWIDYMLSEKPVLVALNGHYSIINDAECGKFIESNNPELMAKEILNFSRMDPALLKQMGENGKRYLLNNLTYDRLTDRYLEVIDGLFKE